MSKNTIYIIVAVVIVLIGAGIFMATRKPATSQPVVEQNNSAGSGNTKTESQSQTKPVATKSETMNDCTRTFDRSKMTAPHVDFANKKVTLQVKGLGNIVIDLYDKDAPKTVENFVRLAGSGYFDCLTFHRIAKGFVVQGGDPTGTGSGGETALGTTLVDELNANTMSYKQGYVKGVVAMANRSLAGTGTSQFFIMLGDADLPHQYTIFGKVSSGIEVVDNIGQMEIVPELGPTDGKPKQTVVIEKAVVSSK